MEGGSRVYTIWEIFQLEDEKLFELFPSYGKNSSEVLLSLRKEGKIVTNLKDFEKSIKLYHSSLERAELFDDYPVLVREIIQEYTELCKACSTEELFQHTKFSNDSYTRKIFSERVLVGNESVEIYLDECLKYHPLSFTYSFIMVLTELERKLKIRRYSKTTYSFLTYLMKYCSEKSSEHGYFVHGFYDTLLYAEGDEMDFLAVLIKKYEADIDLDVNKSMMIFEYIEHVVKNSDLNRAMCVANCIFGASEVDPISVIMSIDRWHINIATIDKTELVLNVLVSFADREKLIRVVKELKSASIIAWFKDYLCQV